LYDLNNFFVQVAVSESQPNPSDSIIDTVVNPPVAPIQALPVEPEVKTELSNKPVNKVFDIHVKATSLSGVAPLTVGFILSASNPDMVGGTYSKIEGNEKIYDGIPLSIEHTFNRPGKYPVVFAFRSKEGKIVKDILEVEVREESFEDFKLRQIGR
jgi:hypothetical protein